MTDPPGGRERERERERERGGEREREGRRERYCDIAVPGI